MRRHPLRVLWRLGCFLFLTFLAFCDFLTRKQLRGRTTLTDRAGWTHAWAPIILRALKIEFTVSGTPPSHGFLVANHLSYLDILILTASQPLIFVGKSELQSWPWIGWLVRCGGTIFVNRQRKSDVVTVSATFASVMAERLVLVFFPEGTSTGGDRVLPFKPSLLEPAASNGWPVTPAYLSYSLSDGSPSEEVCYWGDMTFLPHFLNLLSKRTIKATVRYGPTLPSNPDRKELARTLHAAVTELGPP